MPPPPCFYTYTHTVSKVKPCNLYGFNRYAMSQDLVNRKVDTKVLELSRENWCLNIKSFSNPLHIFYWH